MKNRGRGLDIFFVLCYSSEHSATAKADTDFGPLAQLVEQQTLNLWVGSSKLPWLNLYKTMSAVVKAHLNIMREW